MATVSKHKFDNQNEAPETHKRNRRHLPLLPVPVILKTRGCFNLRHLLPIILIAFASALFYRDGRVFGRLRGSSGKLYSGDLHFGTDLGTSSLEHWRSINHTFDEYQQALDCWGSREAGGTWIDRGVLSLLWPSNQPMCQDSIRYFHDKGCREPSSRKALNYSWQPSNACPVGKPEVKNLRDSLCGTGTGSIAVVGDSMSDMFYITLLNMLGACSKRNSMTCTDCSMRATTVSECSDGTVFELFYFRNDYLDINGIRPGSQFQTTFHHEIVSNKEIKTVIFNRGAHFEPTDLYRAGLEALFSSIRQSRPDIRAFFRNTPSGHPLCFDPPSKNRNVPLVDIEAVEDGLPYHWDEFSSQNNWAKLLSAEYGIAYLDVASATALRADSHCSPEDCLHYCIPGPVDLWVEMFVWSIHLWSMTTFSSPVHP